MKLYYRILASFFILISFEVRANENFFNKAKDLFEEKKFEDSKFLFQRNIVFNPKDASSYLYLAKIYDSQGNKKELEKNLNTTLLLEPNNEEANYMLIDIELKRSNFIKVEELKKNFKNICLIMCEKLVLINSRLKELE